MEGAAAAAAAAGAGVGWGVGCVNANVTNMKLDYYSIQNSVHMHQSKNSFEPELFPLLLTCHCVQI